MASAYYQLRSYHDSLEALKQAILLDAGMYEAWYNLGVLVSNLAIVIIGIRETNIPQLQYDAALGQHANAADAFRTCLELNPKLPEIQKRHRILKYPGRSNHSIPTDNMVRQMCDSQLLAISSKGTGKTSGEMFIKPTSRLRKLKSSHNHDGCVEEDAVYFSRWTQTSTGSNMESMKVTMEYLKVRWKPGCSNCKLASTSYT